MLYQRGQCVSPVSVTSRMICFLSYRHSPCYLHKRLIFPHCTMSSEPTCRHLVGSLFISTQLNRFPARHG